jgi:hypothetical protein
VYRPFQFRKRRQYVIRAHDETRSVVAMAGGTVIEAHERKGNFKEW